MWIKIYEESKYRDGKTAKFVAEYWLVSQHILQTWNGKTWPLVPSLVDVLKTNETFHDLE